MIYKNVNYNSLPQQVEKNRVDIEELQKQVDKLTAKLIELTGNNNI